MKQNRIVQIKKILLSNKKVFNYDLCERLGVSVATIRRDLDQLESEGIIKRVYGGAELTDNSGILNMHGEIPEWNVREIENIDAKRSIAYHVAELIPDNCTVLLDSGTSIFEVAKLLVHRKNLTVVTNSLRTASLLGMYKDLQVYCIGGIIKVDMLATSGILASECLSFFSNIDVAVISADGFIPSRGIMEYSMEIAMLKKNLLEKTNRIIAAIDHTKFNVAASVTACPTKRLSAIVTDRGVPIEDIEYLKNIGVDIIIADAEHEE